METNRKCEYYKCNKGVEGRKGAKFRTPTILDAITIH